MTGVFFAGLPLSRVEPDLRFCFSYPVPSDRLINSVRDNGVLQPVWIAEGANGKKALVSGFRRFDAAARAGLPAIPALALGGIAPYDLFIRHVCENMASRDLNSVELALTVSAAMANFGKTGGDVMEGLLPRLGLERSRKILDGLLAIAGFGPAARELASARGVAPGRAAVMASCGDGERETVCQWLLERRFGVNRSLQLFETILEIAAIEKTSAESVIGDVESSIPADMDPPARAARLFDRISARRNPQLEKMKTDFADAVKAAGLPAGVDISPPANFEGRHIEFRIRAGDAKTAAERARALAGAGEEKLAPLFKWI